MIRFLSAAALTCLVGLTLTAGEPAKAPREAHDLVFLSDKGPILIRLNVYLEGKPLLDASDELMGKVFKYLDQNGDGSLSKEESAATPPPTTLNSTGGVGFGGRPGAPGIEPPAFEALDTDKDGKVSQGELAAYYRKNGVAAFYLSQGQATRGDVLFLAVDGARGGRPSSAAVGEALFKLLDANKDGKLSKVELAKASNLMAKLDENDDEVISAGELPAQGSGGIQYRIMDEQQAAAAVVARQGPQAGPMTGPFVAVAPGTASDDLAKRLLEQYGEKGAKKLKAAQIKLDKEAFAKLDADKDGELDAEELAHFARRAPDLEVTARLGKKDDKDAAVEVTPRKDAAPLAANATVTKKGTVMLELGVTRLEFKLGEEGDAQFRIPGFGNKENLVRQFGNLDKDENGSVDAEEAKNSPFRATFKQMDRDGDGKLTQKELLAYYDAMEELQKAAKAGSVTLGIAEEGGGVFALADADGDGRLSLRELRAVPKLLDQLDRDKDGVVARTEVPRGFNLAARPGPANAGGGGVRIVVAGGGFEQPQPMPERKAGPLWFRKMDRNRDSDVSRREFIGTDEQFRLIDVDGDSLISADEAQKYDDATRKAASSS